MVGHVVRWIRICSRMGPVVGLYLPGVLGIPFANKAKALHGVGVALRLFNNESEHLFCTRVPMPVQENRY